MFLTDLDSRAVIKGYVQAVARSCDPLEYLLTGRDEE
jgi:hypothetical protein